MAASFQPALCGRSGQWESQWIDRINRIKRIAKGQMKRGRRRNESGVPSVSCKGSRGGKGEKGCFLMKHHRRELRERKKVKGLLSLLCICTYWTMNRIYGQARSPFGPGAATPLGLDFRSITVPRVAHSSQPWALRRNPFGIRDTNRPVDCRVPIHLSFQG